MAPTKNRRSRRRVVLPDTEKPFPFMSLPPELRLMIYDILIREQDPRRYWSRAPADFIVLSEYSTALSSSVKSLLKVKDIRAEVFSRLIRRSQFEWAGYGILDGSKRWLSFKRYVLPFIDNFTLSIEDPNLPHKRQVDLFHTVLTWMRWRSQRSHLYPWQLKSLTVREASREWRDTSWLNAPYWARMMTWMRNNTEDDVSRFLKEAPMVPGLSSLTIVLKNEPSPKAAKAFVERCVRCGVESKIGLWQYDDRRMAEYWLHLEDGQLIQTTSTV